MEKIVLWLLYRVSRRGLTEYHSTGADLESDTGNSGPEWINCHGSLIL